MFLHLQSYSGTLVCFGPFPKRGSIKGGRDSKTSPSRSASRETFYGYHLQSRLGSALFISAPLSDAISLPVFALNHPSARCLEAGPDLQLTYIGFGPALSLYVHSKLFIPRLVCSDWQQLPIVTLFFCLGRFRF